MNSLRFTTGLLAATFLITAGFVPGNKKPAGFPAPLTIVTDQSWDVSGSKTRFGEYPLSGGQIASASASMPGGTYKAVAAAYHGISTIVPGTVPIWRNYTADAEAEAYQFRKMVSLGADPIRKATLVVNCDDAARIYINKRLVISGKRDETHTNGYGDRMLFRSLTAFLYDRTYTYDVTDYFFTNVDNTIFAEVGSVAYQGGHAYLSAKLVIEFAPPSPAPARAAAPAQGKQEVRQKVETSPAPPSKAAQAAEPEKTVFEAGRDPGIETLRVGSIIELGHVYFKADDYRLDSASYRTLAALATFLKRHTGLKIEIGGHTNLRPTDSFAAGLSANRARAVVRYLTDNGVAPERLTYKGYGKSRPRVEGISKEADRANQRVEVKVLEK